MIVGMLQIVLDLSGIQSLKDKRRILLSLKDRIRKKFKVSIAEISEMDSLVRGHLGVALVTNDRVHGRQMLDKISEFIQDNFSGRILHLETQIEDFS